MLGISSVRYGGQGSTRPFASRIAVVTLSSALAYSPGATQAQTQPPPSRTSSWFWTHAPTSQGQVTPGYHSVPGHIHVPSAQSLAPSEIWFSWSNYSERGFKTHHSHNFHIAAGLGQGLTIAGRMSGHSYNHRVHSDLSLHLHWKIPWIPRHWFDFAVGIQDIGGAIAYYHGYYAVASREFGPLALTLGWGHGEYMTKRSQGLLAAIGWQPFSFLGLSTEFDGHDLNAKARLSTPDRWLHGRVGMGLQGAVTHITRKPDFFVSAYAQLSIASSPGQQRLAARALRSPRNIQVRTRFPLVKTPRLRAQYPGTPTQPSTFQHSASSKEQQTHQETQKLAHDLIALGLERVRVAQREDVLRICIDNAVFERSHIDALGVVLGLASSSPQQRGRIEVTVTKNALPLMTVSTQAAAFRRMILGAAAVPGLVRVQSGSPSPCPALASRGSSGGSSQQGPLPFGRPRLSLVPRLAKTAATEVGYLDLQLNAMWGLELPLAYGSTLKVAYQHEIWHTSDFARHGMLSMFRLRPGFVQAALHQAFPILPGLQGLLSLGLFDIDQWTAALNLRYQRGVHTLSAFGSVWTHRFDRGNLSALGQYRIEWPGGPVGLTLTGGQFPDRSRGVRTALDFAWGDTLISAYFRYGEAKALGVGLTVPLAPRKNRIFGRKQARVILSTSAAFSQSLHTRVGESHNSLMGRTWLQPGTAFAQMGEIYSEQGRLTESRVALGMERMRDAFHRYVTHARPKRKPQARASRSKRPP